MASEAPLLFVPVGDNPARPFGMDARERACRLASNGGLECAETVPGGRAALVASMGYAWDPAWLKAMQARPHSVLTLGGKPVMAHVPNGDDAGAVIAALQAGGAVPGYAALRKRDRPFVQPLDAADPEPVERAAYDAAYKGVTDLLTLYLWRGPAFYLTRWAAQAGLSPNVITGIGAVFCLLAFILFWRG